MIIELVEVANPGLAITPEGYGPGLPRRFETDLNLGKIVNVLVENTHEHAEFWRLRTS